MIKYVSIAVIENYDVYFMCLSPVCLTAFFHLSHWNHILPTLALFYFVFDMKRGYLSYVKNECSKFTLSKEFIFLNFTLFLVISASLMNNLSKNKTEKINSPFISFPDC